MPELPEVETTRRGIAPALSGQGVRGVIVRDRRLRRPVPEALAQELPGRTLGEPRRRGKYLMIPAGDHTLLIHLGMSGSLRIVPADMPAGAHDHVDILLGTTALRYHDPRRFGLIDWWPGDAQDHPLLSRLGPEPLGPAFDGSYLHRATRGKRAAIKCVLMDAQVLVGVGNIYASESLFRARIRPATTAAALSAARCARLAQAVRETLSDAITAGGSTLRDFVRADGQPGYFQLRAAVYGRAGEPCRACGTAIRHAVMAQRATYWCPHCQR